MSDPMRDEIRASQDVSQFARPAIGGTAPRAATMARGLVGSEILKIANEIRALKASGHRVCDLTVGDFNPAYFPIPLKLSDGIRRAYDRSETNYPPSSGMLDLRQAVRRFYGRELGLDYPLESVLITAGSRPCIFGFYHAVVDPGDRVVYPVPSWNNNHYVHMTGAVGVPLVCRPEHRFMPTPADIIAALPSTRLLCLNSPLNPTGTVISREALSGICDAVIDENRRREARDERPVYVMYDQVYWMLTFGQTQHVTPVELRPEMARYTLFVDGISKAFAATGVRVGWAIGPTDIIDRMSAILTHAGAWAPRAEQVAVVDLLEDPEAVREFLRSFRRDLQDRLTLLHDGIQSLAQLGLAVDSIPPMGAIYLTARLHPFGKRTPDGRELRTNDDIRTYLLDKAAVAVVPFQAFGVEGDQGWFRLSVGATSKGDIEQAIPRLAEALRALR
ncbi:MAG: aminotransferase class I/II-fold pyridoxal phosphate-dependent enzyme [Vicinamibacterales bacterium]